jgi:hypothetical protein
MRVGLIVLSLAVAAHASNSEHTLALVAKLQAERQRKQSLINQLNVKEAIRLEELAEKENKADKTPELWLESQESEGALAEAKNSVEEMMLAARNKLSDADAMEEKAAAMQTTIDGVMTEEQKKKLAKIDFETSFIEQEARKKSMRERDTSFVQLEVEKLAKQKLQMKQELKEQAFRATQEQKELREKAKVMKAEGEKELKQSESQWSGVEAVSQKNERRPRHMAPKWMIEAQLSEAMDAHSDEAVKITREKTELELQKSYLWKQMGKKYTCASGYDNMKAFILDSQQDSSNRADCLEMQLNKYCMHSLRAPAVSQEAAVSFMNMKQECLPNGVDERVPENRRGPVAAKWCSLVQILQGVAAQPPQEKYFALLEDHVKVDKMNFEETLKSFASEYFHDWDLLQVDPLGKHNDADKMVEFNGRPVYRNSRNGQYFGFNSVLMKTASAPKILDIMMNMPAVPLDTLPTLLNEQDGKISAASIQADIVNLPKKSSLIATNSYSKCEATTSALLELQQMEQQTVKPQALIQTNEPLDFFAFEKKMGDEMATKNWQNRDLTDF